MSPITSFTASLGHNGLIDVFAVSNPQNIDFHGLARPAENPGRALGRMGQRRKTWQGRRLGAKRPRRRKARARPGGDGRGPAVVQGTHADRCPFRLEANRRPCYQARRNRRPRPERRMALPGRLGRGPRRRPDRAGRDGQRHRRQPRRVLPRTPGQQHHLGNLVPARGQRLRRHPRSRHRPGRRPGDHHPRRRLPRPRPGGDRHAAQAAPPRRNLDLLEAGSVGRRAGSAKAPFPC